VKKVLTDQLVYGPLQNAIFMTFLAVVVEGRSWAATRTKLQADFVGVQSRGWRVWPVVSFVNQEFVPLKASGVCSLSAQSVPAAAALGRACCLSTCRLLPSADVVVVG
jgi:peroxisomal membrane protein 2